MVNIKKFLFTSTFLLFASSAFAQNFEAFVDTGDVAVGQTVNVKLELTGINPTGVPDLSALPNGLKITGQSQQSSLEIVNGKQTSSISWIYNILPSREGTYNIPEIQVATEAGMLSTRPFKIFVKDSGSLPQNTADNSVFLEASLSKDSVYVGEPTIYTVRIYSKYQLNNADLKKPVSEGLVFDQIGEPKISTQIFNGENYNLVTVNFLVTPTKTGKNSIGSSVLKGRIALPNKQNAQVGIANGMNDPFFDDQLSQLAITPFTIASKGIGLVVKEPVKGVQTWLPAQKLEVKSELAGATEGAEFKAKVGEPFTRKIYLYSEGRFGKSLPDLEKLVQNDKFKIYADKPVESGEIKQNIDLFTLIGKRAQSFNYIPQEAGEFELPEIKISWWNTNTDALENAIIPAQKIIVEGLANTAATKDEAVVEKPEPATPEAKIEPIENTKAPEVVVKNNTDINKTNINKTEIKPADFNFEQILMWLTGLAVFALIVLKMLSNKSKPKADEQPLIRREMRGNTQTQKNIANTEKPKFFASDIDSFLNLKSPNEVIEFIQNYAEKKLSMPKNSNVIAIAENLMHNFKFDGSILEAAKKLDASIFAGKEVDLNSIKNSFAKVFKSELKTEKVENKTSDFDKLNPF
jgi:hypothetical protein